MRLEIAIIVYYFTDSTSFFFTGAVHLVRLVRLWPDQLFRQTYIMCAEHIILLVKASFPHFMDGYSLMIIHRTYSNKYANHCGSFAMLSYSENLGVWPEKLAHELHVQCYS